ncbi:hypothetical protein AB0C98_40160 [Streptomyces sp. NPDC048558]|uniref:hypothetical protein n=1 Tax=Streptomyces sp. NPDC048558 TaxID=3155759 RepID=UPI00341FCF04
MRIRATVAAVSGALALSALAVPAAQADETVSRADVAKIREAAHAASGKSAFGTRAPEEGQPYALNVSFSDFKIAKAVKVGTTNHVATKVTYKLTHGADLDITAADFYTDPYIYKGAFDAPDNMLFGNNYGKCTPTSSTTANCTGTIDVYPADGELWNADAGSWKAGAMAIAFNGQDPSAESFDITKVGYADKGGLATTLIQRYSRLTVNASPEPVKKGKTITVTGKLSRANWEDNKYHGYTNQSVKLQFRKKGSDTYSTVKTIKSNSTGELKTAVTASQDGYFRYSFAGTSTTPAVNATGDFVDVQ